VNDQRAAAVALIREYVEEADFVVRREWRAAVRRLERDLRDGYEELATSLVRSADRSLEAARSSGDDPDRAEWIDTELVRLAQLDEAAVALVTDDG
jgi:hypothetical protein